MRLKQFDLEREKKWTLSITVGEMADSNVILSSDSALDQGTASDSFGFRSLLMGSLRYRPIYDEETEFAVQADVFTLYTRDKSFGVSQPLRDADPSVVTISAPWSFKSTAFGFGYKLDLAPGYETIIMSIENSETKRIVNSIIMNVNNLVVMNSNWFANWNIESRKDTSGLDASVGENDADAYKVRLVNTNTIVLNDAKNRFMTAEGAFTMNQAVGRQVTYNRADLNVGYLQPFYGDTVASAKLAYYLLTYPTHSLGRVDNNVTATIGASKRISDIFTTGLTGAYNFNGSSVEANQFKKWTMMLTLSAVTGL